MQAGKLRKRVTIQTPTGAVDAFGEQTSTWTTLATVWGEPQNEGGAEGTEGARMQADVTEVISIRYYPGLTLTPGMRLVIGTRYLDVVSVVNVEERGVEWLLSCRESA